MASMIDIHGSNPDHLPPSNLERISDACEQLGRDEVEMASHRHLITGLLQYVGEDPDREGLRETPERVLKAWKHWCQGYNQDPRAVLKTFADGAEGVDEMVMVGPIQFYSHCEHHLAPFYGSAWVAYIPKGRVVGLSKLARVVDIYAHRLQVQERMTNEVANAIDEVLQPVGVGVIVKAAHMCMCSRGVNKQDSFTVTSALRGAIKNKGKARAEFLRLAGF